MAKFILERCLNMTTIMGLLIGAKKKRKGWLLVALISASIHLGLMIGYSLPEEDSDTEIM